MNTYQREVSVDAPFEAVWDFHSTTDGLVALTPDWLNLRIEAVRGPDEEPDPDVLDVGSTIRSSVRPFGVGPRQEWISEITARERSAQSGYFTDVMSDGPFREWRHTHRFESDGESTLVRDTVEYRLPLGGVGDIVGPLARIGFAPMFWYRHRETRSLLE